MLSHPRFKTNLFNRPLDKVLVTDFFGGVQSVLLTESAYPLKSKGEGASVLTEKSHISASLSPFPVDNQPSSQILPKSISDLIPLQFLVATLIFGTLVAISIF